MVKKVAGTSLEVKKKLVQNSWNFVNDSYGTDLCLRFPPREIASSTVYLAGKYQQHENPDTPPSDDCEKWASILGLNEAIMHEICHEILELYKHLKKPRLISLRRELLGKAAAGQARSQASSDSSATSGTSNRAGKRERSPVGTSLEKEQGVQKRKM